MMNSIFLKKIKKNHKFNFFFSATFFLDVYSHCTVLQVFFFAFFCFVRKNTPHSTAHVDRRADHDGRAVLHVHEQLLGLERLEALVHDVHSQLQPGPPKDKQPLSDILFFY